MPCLTVSDNQGRTQRLALYLLLLRASDPDLELLDVSVAFIIVAPVQCAKYRSNYVVWQLTVCLLHVEYNIVSTFTGLTFGQLKALSCVAVQLSAALLILSLIHYGAKHGPSWLDHFKWLAVVSIAAGLPEIAFKAINGLRHLVSSMAMTFGESIC